MGTRPGSNIRDATGARPGVYGGRIKGSDGAAANTYQDRATSFYSCNLAEWQPCSWRSLWQYVPGASRGLWVAGSFCLLLGCSADDSPVKEVDAPPAAGDEAPASPAHVTTPQSGAGGAAGAASGGSNQAGRRSVRCTPSLSPDDEFYVPCPDAGTAETPQVPEPLDAARHRLRSMPVNRLYPSPTLQPHSRMLLRTLLTKACARSARTTARSATVRPKRPRRAAPSPATS